MGLRSGYPDHERRVLRYKFFCGVPNTYSQFRRHITRNLFVIQVQFLVIDSPPLPSQGLGIHNLYTHRNSVAWFLPEAGKLEETVEFNQSSSRSSSLFYCTWRDWGLVPVGEIKSLINSCRIVRKNFNPDGLCSRPMKKMDIFLDAPSVSSAPHLGDGDWRGSSPAWGSLSSHMWLAANPACHFLSQIWVRDQFRMKLICSSCWWRRQREKPVFPSQPKQSS